MSCSGPPPGIVAAQRTAVAGFAQDGAAVYHGLIAPSGGGTVFDVTHTFGASANAFTCMFGWEETDTISSVAIDPAGANIAMTQLATATQGDNKCAAYYAHSLALGAGARTIRLTFSAAITSSGIVIETQSYTGAAAAAPTPFDTDNSTTGNVDGLSLTAPNAAGIMKVVIATNGTAGLTVTPTGFTQTGQHIQNEFTVTTGHKLGSLTNPETPGATLSSGTMRNCAIALVVNPA